MKTNIQTRSNIRGSILIVTLVTGMIIGVVIASYLTLVSHQNATVARSQTWNAALAAAEAGVEEALAQLNPGGLKKTINRGANGWAFDGQFYNAPSPRSLKNASYEVRFTNSFYPVIYSKGYASNAALGTVLMRQIEVKTVRAYVFTGAMTALGNIDMNGNGIRTDSYNSTNGPYNSKTARANGDVASVNGIVDVGNANIYGHLFTGPNGMASVDTLKNNGLVGDMNWKGPGIQAGHYSNDLNTEYPDVNLAEATDNMTFRDPTGPMINKNINGVTYDYVFTGGSSFNTVVPGFTKPIYVGSNVTVNLYITGNVRITGNNSIKVEKGGTLNIYMGGASFDLGGGGVVNDNKSPLHFAYYGLPSNTSLKIGGNTEFYGSFYAPQANVTVSGGGDFFGSIVGKTVTMNGNYKFHFDEALPAVSLMRGYIATSWREL